MDLLNHVRVLVAPCGCFAAADVTDGVPGFCRPIDEAREDVRDGFTETAMSPEEWRAAALGCEHTPEWGCAS
jgi:hypothetical protein